MKNLDKVRPDGPLGSKADFTFYTTLELETRLFTGHKFSADVSEKCDEEVTRIIGSQSCDKLEFKPHHSESEELTRYNFARETCDIQYSEVTLSNQISHYKLKKKTKKQKQSNCLLHFFATRVALVWEEGKAKYQKIVQRKRIACTTNFSHGSNGSSLRGEISMFFQWCDQ